MVDIARLGLAVDSSQVERGTVSLHQLTGAAGQASAAAHRLAGATQVEATGQKAAAAATAAHTAALNAQNAVMRSGMHQRTMMIYQLNDVAVSLASGMNPAMVAMQQGSQILQGGLMPALRTIGDLAKGLVTRFWPVAVVVGAVTAAFGALTTEINRTATTQVSMTDVMLASWQLLSERVATLFAPVVEAAARLWEWMSPHIASTVNGIIGAFDLAFKDITTMWNMLPAALGDAIYRTANDVVNGVIYMVRGVQVELNSFIAKTNGLLAQMGMSTKLNMIALSGYQKIDNPFAGAQQGYEGQLAQNRADVANTDYLGIIGARAQDIARTRAEMEKLGGAASTTNDAFGRLVGMTNTFADATRSAFSNLGTGIIDAFKKGGDVAANFFSMVLDRVGQVGESLLNTGLNSLLDFGINALFGGIGGGLGTGAVGRGVFGGMGGFFPAFPGMAEGGTVAGAGLSWVGERGPELLHLPRGAQVIPNAPSMAMAANQNASNDNMHITVGVSVDSVGNITPYVESVTRNGIQQFSNRELPSRVQSINANPYRRG